MTGASYNVAVNVTALAPGTGTPTGTVTIDDGTDSCGPIDLVAGGGSCSLVSTTAGPKTITATYHGDDDFNVGSGTTAHTVDPDPTSASVSSDFHPSVHGQSVTFTASVSHNAPGSGMPTGTVTFMDGGSSLGPGTLNGAGQATLSTSGLTTATHSIRVVYAGDGNYAGVTSPPFSQVVNQALTTTVVALTSGTDPSTFGSSLIFTATIAPVPPGAGAPTGTVQFKDGAADLGAPATVSAGQATFPTSLLAVGSHTISAVYAGDVDFSGSFDPTGVSQEVDKSASSTSVATSATPLTYGAPVTFTATVSGAGSTPTGTVTFNDGATSLASRSLASGVATFTTLTPLAGGLHAITVAYGGDANYNSSTGTLSGGEQVDKAPLTVTADDKTRPYGQANPVPLTASYTGFVNSEDFITSDLQGSPACSTLADATSSVIGSPYAISCSMGTLTSADYSFTFADGSMTITKATSSTVIASNHDPSVFGQAVTFTATIGGFGAGSATGNVDFIINGGAPQTAAVSGTTATYTTSALAVGTYSVEADYGGDGNMTTSTDTLASNQTVAQALSRTQITSDLSSATRVGDSYNVAVLVTAVSPGAGTPGGAVNVSDGAQTCPVTLSAGAGSCSLTSTSKGRPKTITANYTGNASFAISSVNTIHIVDAVPVANAEPYVAYEAGGSPNKLVVAAPGVLANDTDADNDPLTATNATTPSHGTVVLNLNGSFTYTPTNLYVGPDTFTYTANDSLFDSTPTTVSINVQAVNQPPTFTLDTSTVTVDENQFDSAPDVIANKATLWSQGPGDSGQLALAYKLNVSSTVPNLLSQLGIDSSGTLSFKTVFGVPGSATISVQAVDNGGVAHGGLDTSPAQSFSIVVTYHNQAPIANGDLKSVGQNSSGNTIDVLVNDVAGPPDEQPGGAQRPDHHDRLACTQPAHGHVTIINDNTLIDYTPPPGSSAPRARPELRQLHLHHRRQRDPHQTSSAGTVFLTVTPSVSRYAGSDRYATGVAIVTANYGADQPVIYVATGTNFPDGLAGGGGRRLQPRAAGAASTARAGSIPANINTELNNLIGPDDQDRRPGRHHRRSARRCSTCSPQRRRFLPDGVTRNITRLADDNRYDTAVKISADTYPSPPASRDRLPRQRPGLPRRPVGLGRGRPPRGAAAPRAGQPGQPQPRAQGDGRTRPPGPDPRSTSLAARRPSPRASRSAAARDVPARRPSSPLRRREPLRDGDQDRRLLLPEPGRAARSGDTRQHGLRRLRPQLPRRPRGRRPRRRAGCAAAAGAGHLAEHRRRRGQRPRGDHGGVRADAASSPTASSSSARPGPSRRASSTSW